MWAQLLFGIFLFSGLPEGLPEHKVQVLLLSNWLKVLWLWFMRKWLMLSVLNMPRPDFAFIFIIWKSKVVHVLSLIWWWWTRRGTQWPPNSLVTLWGDPSGPSELRWCYWEAPVWGSPAWRCGLSGVNSGALCRQWAVSSSWCLKLSQVNDIFRNHWSLKAASVRLSTCLF